MSVILKLLRSTRTLLTGIAAVLLVATGVVANATGFLTASNGFVGELNHFLGEKFPQAVEPGSSWRVTHYLDPGPGSCPRATPLVRGRRNRNAV